jgi:hypothetical protein
MAPQQAADTKRQQAAAVQGGLRTRAKAQSKRIGRLACSQRQATSTDTPGETPNATKICHTAVRRGL